MKKLIFLTALTLLLTQTISALSPLDFIGSYYTTIVKEMTDIDGVTTFVYKMLSVDDVTKISDSGKTIQDIYPEYKRFYPEQSKPESPGLFFIKTYGAIFAAIGGVGYLVSAAQDCANAKKPSDYRRASLKALGGAALLATAGFLANSISI